MELTSIYGEMFSGEIVSELDNVVVAEDELGNRYTVHKSTLGNHKAKRANRNYPRGFNLVQSMRMGAPKRLERGW